jgi:LacI family transcriptional regulator
MPQRPRSSARVFPCDSDNVVRRCVHNKKMSLDTRNGKNGKATLIDVAKYSGVSLKTASRVLNNEPDVSEFTAERVRAVMDRLGYHPNLLARGLKTRASSIIGMIVPDISDPFTAAAIHAVMQVARQKDYTVVLTCSEGSPETEQTQIRTLLRRQVEGLIVMPADQRSAYLAHLHAENLPIVAFDQPIPNREIPAVAVTNRGGARTAVEHLLGHGCKRIVAVGAKAYLHTISRRLQGYRDAVDAAGCPRLELIAATEQEIETAAFHRLLADRDAQAIFTLNSVATARVLHLLKEEKLQVPGDVALACFDDFELASAFSPGLTVVRQPVALLGRRSAEILFEQKENPRASVRIKLATELIVRSSCGCVP